MAFDLKAALDAGGNKSDIIEYLAKSRGFDLEGARKAEGYNEDDLLDYLVNAPKPNKVDKKPADPFSAYNSATDALSMDSTGLDTSDVSHRDIGIAGRAGLEGLAALPQAVGWIADKGIGLAGGETHMGDVNIGSSVADAIGLPKAETDAEKAYSAIIAGGTSALTPVGVGKALMKYAPKAGEFLSAAPISQVVGGVAASSVDDYGRRNGWTDGARMAASILAGMSPAAGSLAGNGVRRVADSSSSLLGNVTKTGRERTAGGILASMAEDEMKQNPNYFADAAAAKSTVPGYQRTLGQATGNERIAALEHSLPGASTEGQGPLAQRRTQNSNALAAEQESVLAPVEERLAREEASVRRTAQTKGTIQTPEQAGENIRNEFTSANAGDKAIADSMYADARAASAGQTAFDPTELRGTMTEFEQPGRNLPSSVTAPMGALDDMIKNGQFPDYELLTEWSKQAKNQARMPLPDGNAHIAGQFADNLENYIDATVAGNTKSFIGDPSAVSLYKQARANWRDNYIPKWETGRNLDMISGGKEFGGVKVPNEKVPGLYAGTRTGMEDFGRWATPEAKNAMSEYVRGSLRDAIDTSSADSIASSVTSWMSKNPHMKDFAPEVWSEAESLVKRSGASSNRQAQFGHAVKKSGDTSHTLKPNIDLDRPQYNPLFTTQDKGRLKAVQEETRRASVADKQGRVPGSDTIVNKTLAENLGFSSSPETDSILKGILGIGKDTAFRSLGKFVDTGISRRIGDVLTQAALDPEYAARIVSMRRRPPRTTFVHDAKDYMSGGGHTAARGGILGSIEEDGKKKDK